MSSLSPHLCPFSEVTPSCDTCKAQITPQLTAIKYFLSPCINARAATLYLFDLWPGVRRLWGCDGISRWQDTGQCIEWIHGRRLHMQHSSAHRSKWLIFQSKQTASVSLYLFGSFSCCGRNLHLHLPHICRISTQSTTCDIRS